MTERYSNWRDVKAKRPTSPEREAAAKDRSDREITAYRLAQIRADQNMTQAVVGEAMGVSQRRVSAIEHGDVSRSELGTIEAYVAALGGRVRIVADFGDRTYDLSA
ncbi:helix-turn-helix transcriptional regulator [Promicromonospora sp. NPDC023805]|uniref:helix-turn-helix domain-containing protein n=1 Tax=Promicromonospora sp. NPDC023805 TaxID=3154696 RepID=UPI0033D4E120